MTKISRAKFLRKTSQLAAGTCLLGFAACSQKDGKSESQKTVMQEPVLEAEHEVLFKDNVGLQLYTLREQLSKDRKATLTRVAEIGFKQIELYDTATMQETASIIKDLGMTPAATHIPSGYVTDKWAADSKPAAGDNFEKLLEACAANGIFNAGVAFLAPEERTSLSDYHRFSELANKAGEKAKSMGVQFYYHNHSFEFEPMNGTTPFEVLTGALDPQLVKLELDIFWIAVSGNDPISWINKLGDQVLAIHIKDLKEGVPQDFKLQVPNDAFKPVGQGILDMRSILKAAHEAGVKYGFVEQDQHGQTDPFDNLKASYQKLQELGL